MLVGAVSDRSIKTTIAFEHALVGYVSRTNSFVGIGAVSITGVATGLVDRVLLRSWRDVILLWLIPIVLRLIPVVLRLELLLLLKLSLRLHRLTSCSQHSQLSLIHI